MTHSTRVALRGSRGTSTTPLTNTYLERRTSFLVCFDGNHVTKPFRRWQPLRVTSTIGLQLERLVPLDTIS
jgi:hypothetical protein